MCLFCPKCGFFCPQTPEMPFSVPFSSVKKASEKSADFSEAQIKKQNSLNYAQSATTTTAASGGNREELLGQRPARRKCHPRHDADAGCRNPLAEAIQNRPSSKRSRRTSSVQRLLLMVAYFRLKVAGSKSGSSQLRVMISVRSFRMAMECSK